MKGTNYSNCLKKNTQSSLLEKLEDQSRRQDWLTDSVQQLKSILHTHKQMCWEHGIVINTLLVVYVLEHIQELILKC